MQHLGGTIHDLVHDGDDIGKREDRTGHVIRPLPKRLLPFVLLFATGQSDVSVVCFRIWRPVRRPQPRLVADTYRLVSIYRKTSLVSLMMVHFLRQRRPRALEQA